MNTTPHRLPTAQPAAHADVLAATLAVLATSLAALLSTALLLSAGPAHADVPLPVKVLSRPETGVLSGMPSLGPANHPFKMAATVKASAHNQGNPAARVQRKVNNHAAVYRGLPNNTPLPLPYWPTSADLHSFITTGDLVQAWATMTADGIPNLYLVGYGEFQADATVSWTTSVTIPAGPSRELVVYFALPPASVAGDTEQDGIALWRSRLRGELLVNGYPAWSTEAMRFTIDPYKSNNSLVQTLVLQQFGEPLNFPTDDEDGVSGNDSNAGSVSSPSTTHHVYLSLGRFAGGEVVDLSMIVRGTALTLPKAAGGTDHRCRYSSAESRFFCSRASLSVNGNSGYAPRIYQLP